MCGIAGALSWTDPPDREAVAAMTARMTHRGPDAGGVDVFGPIILGHRRLSVIDTSEQNNQPLSDAGGEIHLVFNGEIYNFRDLRKELEAGGARFRTAGDTEVLIEAYKAWDDDFVKRLVGMYAFALWDAPRRRLLLARDRAGEKPLYYQETPDGLIFASELPALRAHPAVSRRVDPQALAQYLSLSYTLTERPILDGVRRLPPASLLIAEEGRVPQIRNYWDLAACFAKKSSLRFDDAAAELRTLIDRAVGDQLVSDVPLGAFLSGGIDSSTVVEAMTRLRPDAPTRTFSIGFREKTFSELPEARAMADALGVDHLDRVVDADLASALPRIVGFAGEPFADTSIVPVYYLAKLARERVTVALSGDGGDELFAGYETYRADRLRSLSAFVPGFLTGTAARVARLLPTSHAKVGFTYKLQHFLAGHRLDARRAHHSWRVIHSAEQKRALLRPELRDLAEEDGFSVFDRFHDDVRDAHPLDQALYVDFKTWLVDDILVKVDRATMASSLESRAPFLDHRLVEFAASLPVAHKLRGLETKAILKRAQEGRLPQTTLGQAKKGFNAPVSHWLFGDLSERARRVTVDGPLGEWLVPEAVDRLWTEHLQQKQDHGLRLFTLTCLALWLKEDHDW